MHPTLSRYLFGLSQRMQGADLYRRIEELRASEHLPREQLLELQWIRLRALLEHAYDFVPYYRRVWNEHGIRLSQIQSVDDMQVLPFLDKEDVQVHYDDLLSTGLNGVKRQHGRTSGSSGKPKRFLRTQDSKARFWAAQYRAYGWYGIQPGDRQGRFYGMPFAQAQSRNELFKDLVMNRRRLQGVFDLADARLEAYTETLNRFRPVYFNGYASWLSRFAEFLSQRDLTQYDWLPLKAVVSTSEVLRDQQRSLIEKTFRCPVINEYGAAEIGIVAMSCPHGGFHTVPENQLLELLPTDSSEANIDAYGVAREVIVTDLHSQAMPFIRYKVGDYLAHLPDDDAYCACGRTAPMVGSVQGRTNQYVLTPEGELRGGMVFDYMFKLHDENEFGVRNGCVVQKDIETCVMYIVKDVNFSSKFVDYVRNITRKHISPNMQIKFEFVDDLPRGPTGKVKLFSTEIDIDAELTRIRTTA